MVAELQVCLDPLFGCGEAKLFEPGDLELRPVLVFELLERASTPECQCPLDGCDRFARLLLRGEFGESLELARIGLGRHEYVPGASRQDGVGGKNAPKLRDVTLKR